MQRDALAQINSRTTSQISGVAVNIGNHQIFALLLFRLDELDLFPRSQTIGYADAEMTSANI